MNTSHKETVTIRIADTKLEGEIIIPERSESLVIFSHGSGSSRFSPRNNFVATELHKKNIGTFLFDLLTKEEDEIYANRFNIDLITERLIHATTQISSQQKFSKFNLGYFGASTGAASALKASVALPQLIHAIVSRGGRPDLAIEVATKVKSPTLLIVGGKDYDVLRLNQEVYHLLQCKKNIEIVKGATHLFEEPGALQKVSNLAVNWFEKYLTKKNETAIPLTL